MYFRYYGLWMWLPEIYNRMEGTQHDICQTTPFKSSATQSSNISLVFPDVDHTILTNDNKTFNSSTYIADGEICQRSLYTNRAVYLKTFIIAASNIPGAITSIVCIDKVGRRNLLGKNFYGYRDA